MLASAFLLRRAGHVKEEVQQCLQFGISAGGNAIGTTSHDGVDDSVIRVLSETDETGAIERAETDDIVERIEEADQGVQSTNRATDEQATSTDGVAQLIDEVIESSEATDAEADTVAAAAEEQAESIDPVAGDD